MSNKQQFSKILVSVLLIGALCGFSEVFISNILKDIDFPFRAGALTGIGIGLIAIVLAIYKKPVMILGIAAVTIFAKQLIVPVAGAAVACKMNSCLAVGLEYGTLAALAAVSMKSMNKSTKSRILTALGAGAISAVAFWGIGMHVAPCNYLRSFAGMAGLGSFMIREGLSWAIFSAILFPAGWLLGEKIRETSLEFVTNHPALYYTSAISITLALFGITGWLYSIGY